MRKISSKNKRPALIFLAEMNFFVLFGDFFDQEINENFYTELENCRLCGAL